MVDPVQIKRTATNNTPPANNSLRTGELFVEMGTPARLWVGVPTAVDATGRKQLVDTSALAAVTSFNTRTGAIVLASGDVTDALGFTPPSNTGGSATGTWAIAISGNAATATKLATARAINGVPFDGTAAITVTANNANAVTFNTSGAGAASGAAYTGAAAITVSYNTVGAPSTAGAGATGTWAISISGDAASITTTLPVTKGGTGATTAANARTNLGLGSAATLTAGTAANNLVQLDASAKLPPIDGSQLKGQVSSIVFVIDGGGATITPGIKGDLVIPFGCTITDWTLLADQAGSIVVDVWKDTYTNFPPTAADTITASAKPTLAGATKNQNATLTGWTTTVNAGDILRFNVNSATTVQRVTLALKVARL